MLSWTNNSTYEWHLVGSTDIEVSLDVSKYGNKKELEPDIKQARRTALVAHDVVIKLKKMGLPQNLDKELASLSTDLGDLWSAQKEFTGRLECFLKSPRDWDTVGNHLVDLRSSIDHIGWHLNSVRKPLTRITQFAYRKNHKPKS